MPWTAITAEMSWEVRPIGVVTSDRTEPIDDDWDQIPATITLLPPLHAASILGLDDFSHLEVVYLFDRVKRATCTREPGSRVAIPRGPPLGSSRSAPRTGRTGLFGPRSPVRQPA